MEENTQVNILMIEKKVKVLLSGLMEDSIKVNGLKVNNME